jgi:hypothetical protein
MAKHWHEVTIALDYGAQFLANGDAIVSVMWRCDDQPIKWESVYRRRMITGAHDPLNKRGRLWN